VVLVPVSTTPMSSIRRRRPSRAVNTSEISITRSPGYSPIPLASLLRCNYSLCIVVEGVVATNPLEYHVLLALSAEPLYGYAIKEAIAADSGGAQTPRAGTLYRVIARLMSVGWVRETRPEAVVDPHPGLARRYYGLTATGREALSTEARRLKSAAALAQRRLRIAR